MTADAPPGVTSPLAGFLPVPGTDLYYALRFAPPTLQARLTLIESLRATIAGIPGTCSTPDIARTKLAWWHHALHGLPDAPPAHPLLQAVAPLAREDPALVEALFALTDGTTRLLDLVRFADGAEREASYDAVHGPLWAVHARWCGFDATHARGICRRAGVRIELARGLCELRRVVGSGVAWLCRSHEPTAAGLGDADWYAAVAARETSELGVALAESASAVAGLTGPRAALRPLRVLLDLSSLTLRELAADGHRVWERRVELTPLRKLWRALRIRVAT